MRIFEVEQRNPYFPKSKIKQPVYHGTLYTFDKFQRPESGIYVARWVDHSDEYGTSLILYVDVRKIANPGHDSIIVDAAFDRNYKTVAEQLRLYKEKGYDAVEMYGDGDSLILSPDVPIVNAKTGKPM